MFRILCFIWACQVFCGIILISRPKKDKVEKEDNMSNIQNDMSNSEMMGLRTSQIPNIDHTGKICREYNLVSVKAALYSIRFWQYLLMMFSANVFVTIFSYEYKPLGLANGIEDNFLTWAGSFSSITQVISRLSIGYLYDIIGFKILFFVLMGINIANGLTCYWAV